MDRVEQVEATLTFTFQSGYIQIALALASAGAFLGFTFQSGYIQIYSNSESQQLSFSLHSNLVIFK